jgi:hypothetical protein
VARFPDRQAFALVVASVIGQLSCAGEPVEKAGLPAPMSVERAPTSESALHLWLISRNYENWPAWNGIRPSSFAEGGVRVFWSPQLHRSLEMGASSHPVGSAAVRELYEDDLVTPRGWSTMVKLADRGDPDDWLFFEVFSSNASVKPAIAARGAPGCLGCHDDAPDHIHSRL